MSKHIVFLLHGMGEHKEDWSNEVSALLRERYEALENDHLWPWDSSFEPCELRYDDIFEDIRNQWVSGSEAILRTLTDAGVGSTTLNKLTAIANGKPSTFLQTHILDVLHYRFVDPVRESVKVRVAKQITDKLSSVPSGTSWSLIAHSLGTAVAHDTLHAVSEPNADGVPGVRKAHLVMMLANVSRTLQTDAKAYESRVRPEGFGQPGITNHFLNVRHQFDPIPACWPFQPGAEWPSPAVRSAKRFEHLDLSVISALNVHGFDHYLGDPECFVPLFRSLTFPKLVSADEARSLRDAHLATQLPLAKLKKARAELEKMQPPSAISWKDIVRILGAYRDYLR
jgi:hypothetical protein